MLETTESRELRQRRAAKAGEAAEILNKAQAEGRGLNAAQQAQFDALIAEANDLGALLDRQERSAALESELSQSMGRKTSPGGIVEPRNVDMDLAFRAWAMGPNHATREMVEAAERMKLRYQAAELETRALSSITATQGQASIPDELMRAYVESMKWFGRVRNVAEVYPTITGAPLPVPTVDDTANTGEIVADGGAVTTTADPSFGVVTLGAFKYTSKAIIVPWELIQDSGINLPVYLGTALGTRIGRKQNSDYTVGAGTTLPFGVSIKASLGKTATATNAITFDDMVDLYHSVDPAYRDRPGVRWMVHDTTAAYLRKLKATTSGQYLWEMSVQVGQPDRIFGVPVAINNDMPYTMTTGLTIALFGDFGSYKIREVGAVQVIREDGLRMLNGQSVFLGWQRADGNLADTAAVKYLKLA